MEQIRNTSLKTSVVAHAYFQSYKYFDFMKDEIRELLKFKQEIVKIVKETFENIRKKFRFKNNDATYIWMKGSMKD